MSLQSRVRRHPTYVFTDFLSRIMQSRDLGIKRTTRPGTYDLLSKSLRRGIEKRQYIQNNLWNCHYVYNVNWVNRTWARFNIEIIFPGIPTMKIVRPRLRLYIEMQCWFFTDIEAAMHASASAHRNDFFLEIFFSGCIESCQNNNFQWSQWRENFIKMTFPATWRLLNKSNITDANKGWYYKTETKQNHT